MSVIPHEDFLDFGKTMMPMRMENMKELVGEPVDECLGRWRMTGTSNSADLTFVEMDGRGYLYLHFNPNWVHQFHPAEYSVIEEKLEESPFVQEFSAGQHTLITERKWDRHFAARFEKTRDGR